MLFKVNYKEYVNVKHIVRCSIQQDNYNDGWYVNISVSNGFDVVAVCDSKAECQIIINKINQLMLEEI